MLASRAANLRLPRFSVIRASTSRAAPWRNTARPWRYRPPTNENNLFKLKCEVRRYANPTHRSSCGDHPGTAPTRYREDGTPGASFRSREQRACGIERGEAAAEGGGHHQFEPRHSIR